MFVLLFSRAIADKQTKHTQHRYQHRMHVFLFASISIYVSLNSTKWMNEWKKRHTNVRSNWMAVAEITIKPLPREYQYLSVCGLWCMEVHKFKWNKWIGVLANDCMFIVIDLRKELMLLYGKISNFYLNCVFQSFCCRSWWLSYKKANIKWFYVTCHLVRTAATNRTTEYTKQSRSFLYSVKNGVLSDLHSVLK